jgi:hypothetical protein
MTAYDSLCSLLDECLIVYCDWLGSELRNGRFFSFHCKLVNTPQLNTKLLNSYECMIELTNELSWIELLSNSRINYVSPPYNLGWNK